MSESLTVTSTVTFGDYIAFLDESGDPQLSGINTDYPLFVIACCIIKKEDYLNTLLPKLTQLKFDFWGHDGIVLHEQEIRKPNAKFNFLFNPQKRSAFLHQLDTLMTELPLHIIACVIDKSKLVAKYKHPHDPYNIGLQFIMERLLFWLAKQNQKGKTTHLFAECRGNKEDKALELEFRRIADNRLAWAQQFQANFDYCPIDLQFAPKSANLAGLQLADLIARPIGLHVLKPNQENRAFKTIQSKFVCGPDGKADRYELKVFP